MIFGIIRGGGVKLTGWGKNGPAYFFTGKKLTGGNSGLLHRYSVLFTVESLSLLYPFSYLDLYVVGDDALISSSCKPNTYVY